MTHHKDLIQKTKTLLKDIKTRLDDPRTKYWRERHLLNFYNTINDIDNRMADLNLAIKEIKTDLEQEVNQ